MDRESMKALRLDRRLLGRRGWLKREELERELEQLPDVVGKIAPAEEGSDPDASSSASQDG
jgi:hypothetical protein